MSEPALSIDVFSELSSSSALLTMIEEKVSTKFPLAGTLVQYAEKLVSEAAKAKASAKFSPNQTCSWKLPEQFIFSLNPNAQCAVTISETSASFDIASNIESSSSTQKVFATPPENTVYVNIDLDFSIQGTVSVAAPVGTFGIAAKACGAQTATLSFCVPVAGTLKTLAAIKLAFERFVFPLDSSCLDKIETGTLLKVAFDANLNCELDVTYGLGNYKVAAPDLSSVRQSMGKVVDLTPPSAAVDVGVQGSIRYTHSGDFTLIVNKTADAAAKVYLTRSSEDDVDATVGVRAVVTTCVPQLSVSPTALQIVTQEITNNAKVAQQVSSAASSRAGDLVTVLNRKLAGWATSTTGNVGLTVGLSRQKGHVALFIFDVDLSKVNVSEGWNQLVGCTVSQALAQKGFTLEPGSGICDSLKRAATLRFQFFNLFAFSSTSEFFNNSFAEIGKDGSIQIAHDIGKEHESDANKRQRKIRFYFEATAAQTPSSVSISNAQVDLCLELSETGNSAYGVTLANVIGFLPGTAATNAAQEQMIAYVHGKPAGTLDLKFTLKQSAYGKISASPFQGKTPPPLPQQQDADNWGAFRSATRSLVSSVPFVDNLTYEVWKIFNVAAINSFGSRATPDRSHTGDPRNVPDNYLSQFGDPGPVRFFLGASQYFMNLCDDLRLLAAGLPSVQTATELDDLEKTLQKVVSDNDYLDYGLPMIAGLLMQCGENGAQTSTSLNASSDCKSLTCLVTVS